ncbi:MAG: DUF2283 domain-containing protein [Candidatus Omnitrophica bacterium]|nr:DUF2283 domain-containing protein [Candidatus Omnitrophota bacterium]
MGQLTVSYDKDADVLYITEGKPREAIGEIMDDGIIVRRDANSREIFGFTILDFTEHFAGNRPQKIPLKARFSSLQPA